MRLIRQFHWVLSAAIVLAAGCGGVQRRRQAASLAELGSAKMSEGNPEGALANLHQAHELDPKNPEIVHNLGLAYWYKGRTLGDTPLILKGEEFLSRSVKMNSSHPEWFNNLCALYVELARYEAAIENCDVALQHPAYRTPERALNNMGKAYILKGQPERALESLDKALRIQPRACHVLWNRGQALQALARWDEAIRTLEDANRICPTYPGPFLMKGQVLYFGKRDKVSAVAALEKAQALDPNGPMGEEAAKLLKEILSGTQ